MTYKSELQKASFRGIEFGIKDIDTTIGRRTIFHEYPSRDDAYAEDMGRKGREFSINAFVMVPNDFSLSKQLKSALEDYATPGTFVHPTLGIFTVTPKECIHRYVNTDGGIEYFSVTFVETVGNNYPQVTADTQSLTRANVNSMLSDSENFFASKFRVSGYSDFIANSAIDKLNTFVTQFRGLINFGSARNGNPTQYSRLISRLNTFSDNIPSLVFQPSDLASQVNQLNADLNESFRGNLGLANLIQQRLWKYGDDFIAIIATTTLRGVEGDNQTQIVLLIKNSVLAELIRNVTFMTFASVEDATAARESVTDRAFDQLLELGNDFDDDMYRSLQTALTSMIKDVQARSAAAKNTQHFLIKDSMPALCLAYEYYADATEDEDIVNRNKVINPLFVPPNTEVAVVL